jgi:hypothetical protein
MVTSSAVVGSSAIRRSGEQTIAMPIITPGAGRPTIDAGTGRSAVPVPDADLAEDVDDPLLASFRDAFWCKRIASRT